MKIKMTGNNIDVAYTLFQLIDYYHVDHNSETSTLTLVSRASRRDLLSIQPVTQVCKDLYRSDSQKIMVTIEVELLENLAYMCRTLPFLKRMLFFSIEDGQWFSDPIEWVKYRSLHGMLIILNENISDLPSWVPVEMINKLDKIVMNNQSVIISIIGEFYHDQKLVEMDLDPTNQDFI